jgi:hypothetical protein
MKRVMRDVLPTVGRLKLFDQLFVTGRLVGDGDSRGLPDCSPKKTSLNFLSGLV